MTMLILPLEGGGGGGGSGVAIYTLIADLPVSAPDGTVASVIEDQTLRQFDSGSSTWVIVGSTGIIFTGSDTDSIDVSIAANVISAVLLLSSNVADAGNLLVDLNIETTGVSGLRAQLPEADVLGLFSATAPLSYDDSTGVFSISQATTSTDGYLSSTDWDTFNDKVSATRTISTTAPITGGGDLSADRTFAIPEADGSTDGYLSSTDWNTFNDKAPTASPTFTGTVSATAFLAAEGDPSPATGYGFTGDGDTGMYSSGDGAIELYMNGFLRVEFDQSGFKTINGEKFRFPFSAGANGQTLVMTDDATGQTSWGAPTITGSANKLSYFDGAGELTDLSVSSINGVGGVQFDIPIAPAGTGGINVFPATVSFTPTADASNDGYSIYIDVINFDLGSTGFPMSTASGITINNTSLSHQGTGDLGYVQLGATNLNIGNGTDPISVNGFQVANTNGSFNNNVTVMQNIQGYGVSLNMQAGSVMDSSCYVNVFGDFNTFNTTVNSYNSFVANPNIDTLSNNSNYTAYGSNANIDTFVGNAGYFGITLNGTLGTFDTGGYNAISINHTVTSVVNATGLYINMDNVSASGTKRAIDVSGDVNINGSLAFTGTLTIGELNASSSNSVVNGGGNPTTINGIVSQINGTGTVANCDMLGLSTPSLINLDATFQGTSGGFGIGIASLALPNVISMQSGCSLDFITACAYVNLFDAGNTGGTIGQLVGARSFNVSSGGTQTITRSYNFWADYQAGDVATDSWALYDSGAKHNWMKNSLKIGGTAGSTDTVTNTSIGLEIESTALRLDPMDETTRDALTAVEGMMVSNSDSAHVNHYNGVSWTELLTDKATNDATNASWVGSGQSPASASAAADNGETSTGTFDRDIMVFTIYEATGRRSVMCNANYASAGITAVSDPSGIFLDADAGTGIYVSKSAASNVISVKNRLGGTVTITIQAINSNITSSTAWA